MTVNSTGSKIQYNGNGVATAFAFPYPFTNSSDLAVVRTDTSVTPTVDYPLALTTNYTVTGAGGISGTVTITSFVPAATDRITIRRVVALTQLTSYPESGQFPAKAHEAALDLLTEACQQLNDGLNSAITLAPTSAATKPVLADPVANASLIYDATGANIIAGPNAAQISAAAGYAATAQASAAQAVLFGGIDNFVHATYFGGL